MPRMGDALAGLDIRNVRLADPEHRSNRRLCNAHERGLYIFDEHIASQPSGQVRRIPIPDGLLVRLLGGRTLREELRPLLFCVPGRNSYELPATCIRRK